VRSQLLNRAPNGSQQYSITALTDSGGTIKERYAYSAYGVVTITDGSGTARTSTAEGNRYTYTGREWDDVAELYHYRARVYEPLTGRFGSRDPIGFEGSRWNLYAYVGGRPVYTGDPSGLCGIIFTIPLDSVEVCCRKVDVGAVGNFCIGLTGQKHCWIRTSTTAAGLGPEGDPENLPASPCCGTQTEIVDHSDEVGGICHTIPSCDEDCVNRELKIGRDMGDWEFSKNCNTVIRDIMKKCKCGNNCIGGWVPGMIPGSRKCLKWAYPPY
jgi:RHS repeat-associated protein